MRKLIVLIVLLSFSCKKPDAFKKPENLIEKEKMIEVLYDLHLLSATKSSAKEVLADHNIDAEKYVFTKYKIDSTQLAQSVTFYASKPEQMLEIYEEINSRFTSQKTLFEKERDARSEEKKKQTKILKEQDSVVQLKENKKDILTLEDSQ